MQRQASAKTRGGKQRPHPLRITHSFPDPRPSDGERFVELVRMLLKMGQQGANKNREEAGV
jgi:hypothetical protein